MVWIRLFLTCVFSVGLAGSIAYICSEIVRITGKIRNPYYIIMWQKAAVMLYWLPVPFALVYFQRSSFDYGGMAYVGEFANGSVASMTFAFNILGSIWLAGFLVSVLRSACEQYCLMKICRGNVSVDKREYIEIFQEYQKKYGLMDVELFQNDMLVSPIAYAGWRKKIVLPFEDYSEKQLRMIFEHEMNHIYRNDLWWRKFVLITSWIHWFNPIIHLQSKHLIYMEEEVCDEEAGKGKTYYSQKEYAAFLAGLTDNGFYDVSTMALCQSERETIRRLEAMIKNKEIKKPKKSAVLASCMALVILSLIPSGFVSAKTANMQENWMHAKEAAAEGGSQNNAGELREEHCVDDGSVEEINLSSDIEPYSTIIILDRTITGNTRMVYQYKTMSAGDSITIVVQADNEDIRYKIGIKNQLTGEMTYAKGSGLMNYTFEIPEDGRYAAYIQNDTSVTIEVTGSANYFY